MSKDFRLTSLLDKYPSLQSLISNNMLPVCVSAFGENLEKNTLFVTFIVQNTVKLRTAPTITLYFFANPRTRVLSCMKIRLNAGTLAMWFPSITQEITPAILLRICLALHVFHQFIAQVALNPALVIRKNSAARLLQNLTVSSAVLSRAALFRSLSRVMARTKPLTSHLLLKVPFSPAVETLAASMISFASAAIVSRLDLITYARQKLRGK